MGLPQHGKNFYKWLKMLCSEAKASFPLLAHTHNINMHIIHNWCMCSAYMHSHMYNCMLLSYGHALIITATCETIDTVSRTF